MRFRLRLASLLLATPYWALPAQAPTASAGVQPGGVMQAAPTVQRGPTDKGEVDAFLDGLMAAYMRDKHIAGITVSVVRDGKLLTARGYGYADVASRKPVDPERTLFRIGSITKLFTWTAVMQLHEQGKLDLTKDINEYLDFEIPATYEQPITLTDVLTHTPGLEEDSRDLFTEDPAHIAPMQRWLPAHMPARVRPPATFASYSNWATAAAGYIVERVGGETSFDDYIEKHILQPLAMTHTTARQPLPAEFTADMSIGYAWKNGEFEPHKFEIVTGAAPAGSIGASATDMANFMIAHLNNGTFGDARILGEQESQRMQSRLRAHDPRLPGFAHGFYEQSSHGLRIIGHGGDTQWFHSNLSLIPSEGVGVFMSTNTSTGATISFLPFLTAFLDHYYPEPVPALTPKESDKAMVQRYAGEYLFNRTSYTTYQKATGLGGSIPVKAMPDGSLLMQTPFGGLRLVAIDSNLFRDVNSGTRVAFSAGEDGEIAHAYLDAVPMMVMDKASAAHAPSLHQAILGGGLIMFLALVITAVIRFFLRNTPGRPNVPLHVARGRRALTWAGVMMVVFLVFLAVIVSKPDILFSDNPTILKVALLFPVLAALFVLWGAWEMLGQWIAGDGSIWMRVRHSLAVVVALVFFWSLNYWNLLGWRM